MTKEQERILGNVERVFLPILKQVFEENLIAVILYGSAVKGMFTKGVSDVNVLIILRDADPAAVVALGGRGKSVLRKNRITPLLLTEKEYLGSADIFPLEYLDILASRKVLHGIDPTPDLKITQSNLRHQVEAQLRGTIGALRSALLASRGKSSILRRYLKDWFGSQNALIRGLLRLGGIESIPDDIQSISKVLGEQFGIDSGSLIQLARIRTGEKIDAAQTVEGVLIYLTRVVEKVDNMDESHDE